MVKKTNLDSFIELKQTNRQKSKDEDSDDFSKGYDSTSSEDAEVLMYQLENMDLGKHVPGSKVAYKAQLLLENQQQKAIEDFEDTNETN